MEAGKFSFKFSRQTQKNLVGSSKYAYFRWRSNQVTAVRAANARWQTTAEGIVTWRVISKQILLRPLLCFGYAKTPCGRADGSCLPEQMNRTKNKTFSNLAASQFCYFKSTTTLQFWFLCCKVAWLFRCKVAWLLRFKVAWLLRCTVA
jgi:hypothetical protein